MSMQENNGDIKNVVDDGNETSNIDASSILYAEAKDGNSPENPDSSNSSPETKQDELESESYKLPDKYEFKTADGREYDPVFADELSTVSRELKLTNEKANEIFGRLSSVLEKRQSENVGRIHKEWEDASRADQEFGGKHLEQNLLTARKAVDKFGSPELKAVLKETGLGNHPELIRFMYRAGKAISEDSFVGGGAKVSSGTPKDFNARAEALYSTHNR